MFTFKGLNCIRLLCKLDQKEAGILKEMVKKSEKVLKQKVRILNEREEKLRKKLNSQLEIIHLFNNRNYWANFD